MRRITSSFPKSRSVYSSIGSQFRSITMGVTKTTHQEGSGAQPQAGQTVTIEYTGFLKDTSKPDNKGNQYVYSKPNRTFSLPPSPPPLGGRGLHADSLALDRFDSSVGRGDFVTKIGVGQVIKGKLSPEHSLPRPLPRPSRASFHFGDTVLTTSETGWDEGVTQMKVGEKATLDITA